jgi:2-polyprenyl-3-methyl-5-hydroxy-6-metoxy-1,4-benzoquinol methylase
LPNSFTAESRAAVTPGATTTAISTKPAIHPVVETKMKVMLGKLTEGVRSLRWKYNTLSHALGTWSSQVTQVKNRLDLEILQSLSPIERYIIYSGISSDRALFNPQYEGWQTKRISKMLEIYSIDHFKGCRILELGGGHGDIGAFFAELGADVLCIDGRIQNLNFARLKHRKLSNLQFQQFNLEDDFSTFGRFDLIIHFGLLYHLKNLDEHLRTCFALADDIILETVVCDSSDPYKIVYCDERADVEEEALTGVGNRPSPYYIERFATEHGFEPTRYFTSDLNSGDYFCYDWTHHNDERGARGDDFRLRRFWRLQKKVSLPQ